MGIELEIWVVEGMKRAKGLSYG